MACTHNKHIKFFKIYKAPIVSSVDNIKIIPENKRIRILSDITVKHGNINTTSYDNIDNKPASLTTLLHIKHSWTNKPFVGSHTEGSGHEKEFLKFIKSNHQKVNNDNDEYLSD